MDMIDTLVDLRCLELGIAPFSISPSALNDLDNSGALREQKRKFRKIRKKLSKKLKRPATRSDVVHQIRMQVFSEFFSKSADDS